MNENVVTVEAMKQIEQQWAKPKDMASMMALYADGAMFDNIGTQPLVGKDAIQAHYEDMEEEGEVATVENREAVVMGNWGYTSGTWKVEKPSGHVDEGAYLNVIKLVDGEPKLFRQIFEVAERS